MIRKLTLLSLILPCFAVTACSSVTKVSDSISNVGNSIRNIGKKPERVALKIPEAPQQQAVVQNTIEQNTAAVTKEAQSIDRAIQTALANAEAAGNQKQVLAILGQQHARNSDDPLLTAQYARALRANNQLLQARNVLKPFINSSAPDVELLTEMAMVELGSNDYSSAKDLAARAISIDPNNARAYLALGTAQDALKDHINAEQSFRKGLKHWKGDPSPILNNLALNLASQGYLKESLSLLERALKISPNRLELERNRRIIATLLETANPIAPSPEKKPGVFIPDTASANFTPTVTSENTNQDTSPEAEEKNIYDANPDEIIVPKIKLTPIANNG